MKIGFSAVDITQELGIYPPGYGLTERPVCRKTIRPRVPGP